MSAYAEEIDGAVLMTLCDEPGPWPMDELEREIGEPVPVQDAVARLARRGLVRRMKGGFVVASASGRYAHVMAEEGP